LEHGVAAVVAPERFFVGRLPVRHVLRREQAAVPPAGAVHDFLAVEAIDLLRDEASVPGFARLLDLPLAAGLRFGFAQDALIALCQRRITEKRPRLWRRQVNRGRARPVLAEQPLDR